MWFVRVEEEQETSAPPPKKHPGSAIVSGIFEDIYFKTISGLSTVLSL